MNTFTPKEQEAIQRFIKQEGEKKRNKRLKEEQGEEKKETNI